jgi:tripartite-type tricarboxylate transporter receptor subunit TctC
MRSCIVLTLCAALVLSFASSARAAYPEKPVQLIVPWGAGGRTDVIARLFATAASKHLGQSMVVVNKTGGASVIGGDYVAKARPDGYTLLAITPGTNVFPPLFSKPPYGPYDFDPVGQLAVSTMMIAVNPSKGWKTIQDVMEAARKRPGEVSYSCVALKAPQFGFLRWADKAGLQFKHVPSEDDAKAIWAGLGGHVDLVMNSSIASIASQFKAGKLAPVLIFNSKRDPLLPGTPTARELGFDVVAAPYTGIAGPKGLPGAVMEKLRETFRKVVADPEFLKGMEGLGESVDVAIGEEFLGIWKHDYEENLAIAKKMGVLK